MERNFGDVTAVLLPWRHCSRYNEFNHKIRVGIDGYPGQIRTKHPLNTRQERYNFSQVPRCYFLIAQKLPQKSKSFNFQLWNGKRKFCQECSSCRYSDHYRVSFFLRTWIFFAMHWLQFYL